MAVRTLLAPASSWAGYSTRKVPASVCTGRTSILTAKRGPTHPAPKSSASIAPPPEAPRSWDSLVRGGVRRADFVILLEPRIADDLPRWPGQPEFATWPFPDIAATTDEEEMAVAAIRMLYALRRRLELLVSLPLHGADRSAVRSDVRDLAHLR